MRLEVWLRSSALWLSATSSNGVSIGFRPSFVRLFRLCCAVLIRPYSQATTAALVLVLGCFAAPKGLPGSPPPTLTPSAKVDVQRCLHALRALSDTTFSAHDYLDGISRLAELVSPGITDFSSPSSSSEAPSPSNQVEIPSTTSGDKRVAPDSTSGSYAPGPSTAKLRKTTDLPFSTTDLSSSTFNGRATFSFDPQDLFVSVPSTSAPPPPPRNFDDLLAEFSNPSFDLALPPTLTNHFAPPNFSSASLSDLPASLTTSTSSLATPTPPNDSSFPLSDFWSLPFEAPTVVEQSFADLMASFGAGYGSGGGAAGFGG
jgi:hypothetical protein